MVNMKHMQDVAEAGSTNAYIDDWYRKYHSLCLASIYNFLLVVDIGGAYTKYAGFKNAVKGNSGDLIYIDLSFY